ncbi:hypothetical protein B8W67_05580 [Mycolicibacillus koreensis]|uniref:Uncharacterized protein n=1 Tax=Mycolicibacillus koreensis TaxID=1069220 RepID=A0AA91SSF8_9MYCO|nr:hypothetical protein B8W67_05580 [Mycolicibacillus koreensis]
MVDKVVESDKPVERWVSVALHLVAAAAFTFAAGASWPAALAGGTMSVAVLSTVAAIAHAASAVIIARQIVHAPAPGQT